jgi:hypothetical protein
MKNIRFIVLLAVLTFQMAGSSHMVFGYPSSMSAKADMALVEEDFDYDDEDFDFEDDE